MKVALVYDWVHTIGGAERILIALHELFPQATLFTAVYDKKKAKWAEKFKIIPSFLQKIPLAKSHHELFPLLTPIAFEQFNFSKFDTVISVTSADAKGIITSPNTLHICYMLTPTRYIWSHFETYLNNKFLKVISKPFVSYLRIWDMVAKDRPDVIISISKTVQNRVKQYYNRDSEIIYPPVSISKSVKIPKISDYYLVISRLVPYKRVDLAIQACNKLNRKLVVIGQGRAYGKLQTISAKNIIFKQNVTEEVLAGYYKNCKALIISCEEDFGLTAVEAQMYGKPVIAFGKGGVTETVNSKTGMFFDKQTVSSLIKAILNFEKAEFSSQDCIDNVKSYFENRFAKEFKLYVDFHYERFFRII